MSLGAFSKTFEIMLLGRTIIGFGSETLFVVIATVVSEWFFDLETSLAFGIYLGVANLTGSASG